MRGAGAPSQAREGPSPPAPAFARALFVRAAPALILALMLGPVLAGLLGTVVPAFGYFPALGGEGVSLGPWRDLLDAPGLGASVRVSATVGLGATILSLAAVILFCAAWQGTAAFAIVKRVLSPLLSVPHAAAAFGLAFMLAPSGWIARMLSPWATGWERPPDLLVVHDAHGLMLMAGLVAKEIPFLLLMTIAALGQTDADRRLALARTLGYGPMAGWLKAVFPTVYAQIRLPVYAVLAYSLSVVDAAIILGPTNPPTLAVQVLRWTSDPDLDMRFLASAGAMLQVMLVAAAIAGWHGGERLVARIGRRMLQSGRRGARDGVARRLALVPMVTSAAAVLGGLLGLALWSFARVWRYPDALPTRWTTDTWLARWHDALSLAGVSALVAAAAAVISLALVVAALENEVGRRRRAADGALVLLYLPLIVPQIGFLFGLQILLTFLRLDGALVALIWVHLVFVLPYVFLALSDPYRSHDRRYAHAALCLQASPAKVFWQVTLPMLLRPILVAAAIGFAVSIGQYLPTIFAGGGRFATITTEAVALAASADRRLIGVYAILQAALPFAGFALALLVPAVAFRSRRGLQVR